jgi:hypothetical protein
MFRLGNHGPNVLSDPGEVLNPPIEEALHILTDREKLLGSWRTLELIGSLAVTHSLSDPDEVRHKLRLTMLRKNPTLKR